MMKTFFCSLFSFGARREWFVYVRHTNRLHSKSASHLFCVFVCVRASAPAVSQGDNDRDGISLVECKRGQTIPIIKNTRQRQQTLCAIISNYSSSLTSSSVRLRTVQCPSPSVHYNWLCVWPTAKVVYISSTSHSSTRPTNDTRKKWSDWLCHRTRTNGIPKHSTSIL